MFKSSSSHVGVRMSAALCKLEVEWINTRFQELTQFLCVCFFSQCGMDTLGKQFRSSWTLLMRSPQFLYIQVEKLNCPFVWCYDRPCVCTGRLKTNILRLQPLQLHSSTVASLFLTVHSFERGYKTFFLNFLRSMTTSSCAGCEVSCNLSPSPDCSTGPGGRGVVCKSCYTLRAEAAKLLHDQMWFWVVRKSTYMGSTMKINTWTSSETPWPLWEPLDLKLWCPSRSPHWSWPSFEGPEYCKEKKTKFTQLHATPFLAFFLRIFPK